MRLQVGGNGVCRFGGVVSAQQGRRPVLREEDVTGPLDFLQFFQRRPQVGKGFLLAERMVQVGERGLRLRLDAAVLRIQQALQHAVPTGAVGATAR